MSDEKRCPNGYPDCEFDHKHELALVGELMRAIGRYNETEGIEACPLCLRDSMLAVAALLQLEAERIDQVRERRRLLRAKRLGDALAKAARTALENVSSAKAALAASSRSKN